MESNNKKHQPQRQILIYFQICDRTKRSRTKEKNWKRQREKSIAKQWKKWSVVWCWSCSWFAFDFVYENRSKFTFLPVSLLVLAKEKERRRKVNLEIVDAWDAKPSIFLSNMTENLTEWPWFFPLSRRVTTLCFSLSHHVCVFPRKQNWNVAANGFIQVKRGKKST